MPRRLPLLLATPTVALISALAGGCVGPQSTGPAPAEEPATAPEGGAEQEPERAHDWRIDPTNPDLDRVRLVSGEWLIGEVVELRNDILVFDSDVLDEVDLDWDEVAEVYSNRPMMVLLESRDVATGRIDVLDDRITLIEESGASTALTRDDLTAIVPGEPEEQNYWSGGFTISVAGRSGNTDQVDSSAQFRLERETADTRARLTYVNTYGEVDGEAVAFNQRGTGSFDVCLSRRLFVRPVGLDYFRDPFQGIERRLTPSAGLGYDLFKSGEFD